MKYKLVLLDLDDTLFDYSKTENYALRKLFHKYSLKFKSEYISIYSKINSGLWKQYENGRISSSDLRIERFSMLLKTVHLAEYIDDIQTFSNDYLYFLSNRIFYEPYAKRTLRYLEKRYKVLFFTNGIHNVQMKRLKKAGLLDDPKRLISSESAGFSKPDRRIFEFALKTAGIEDRAEVILIGDGLGSDIKGSLDFGIDYIWYNRKLPIINDGKDHVTISSLKQLKKLI